MEEKYSFWEETDCDCCQNLRKKENSRIFEMIEIIYLDAVTPTEKKKQYVVVRGEVDINDYSEEEIKLCIASYCFTPESIIDDWLIAECLLEEELINDEYIIAEFSTYKKAQKFITKIVQ